MTTGPSPNRAKMSTTATTTELESKEEKKIVELPSAKKKKKKTYYTGRRKRRPKKSEEQKEVERAKRLNARIKDFKTRRELAFQHMNKKEKQNYADWIEKQRQRGVNVAECEDIKFDLSRGVMGTTTTARNVKTGASIDLTDYEHF